MLAIDPGTSIVNTGISTLLKVGNLTKVRKFISLDTGIVSVEIAKTGSACKIEY